MDDATKPDERTRGTAVLDGTVAVGRWLRTLAGAVVAVERVTGRLGSFPGAWQFAAFAAALL